MKILELCDFFSNYGSNFIPSLAYFEKKLNQLGHEVYFAFSTRNLSEEFFMWEKPFSIKHNTVLFNFKKLSVIAEVADYININNIKFVHGHFVASFILNEIKRKVSPDVVFFEHMHSIPYENRKTLKAYLKRIRNFFLLRERIPKVCVSNSMVNMIKFIYPFTKTYVCINSIDFSRLQPSSSLECVPLNILLFGYNFYVKGVDIAIDAIIEINKNFPAILDIVMSDHYEENLDKINNKYGKIPECVRLLRPTNDVNSLYKSHQIFLNASRSEGFSYAIIEAYYSGNLCIVSDAPANKEAALPNVVFFNSSSKSLVQAFKYAFSIKNNYKNDIDFVIKKYGIDSWSNNLIKLFNL